MRAIGYFRELEQERAEGDSLAQQSDAFLAFCGREGYEPAATFLDPASANGERPGFRQLIGYLQRPEKGFVVVAVCDIGRLGDDLRESARALFQIESLGAQVAIMGAENDARGDGLAHLLDAWESRRDAGAGERVRSAMRKRAVRGEVLGRPPYGYCVGPRRRLEIVPEEAVVVRYVFRLYLHEGLGIRLIARRLNEEGIPTRKGGAWSMVTIRDMLRNRVYLGTYSRFGVRVPGSHPALASPDDFRRVQERMSQRRTAPGGSRRTADGAPREPFILSGLAYCGECGNRMIGISRRQKWKRRTDGSEASALYRYYQCESRTNQSRCEYHTRRAEDLEQQVRDAIVQGAAQPPVLRAGDESAVRAEIEEQCAQLRSRLALLDRRIEANLDAASSGRILRDRLRSEGTALARDRLALEAELIEAEARLRRQSDARERQRRRARDLDDIGSKWEALRPEQRRALLRDVVDRVIVSDDAVQVQLRP